jgi:hypothetical protein
MNSLKKLLAGDPGLLGFPAIQTGQLTFLIHV